MPEIRVLDLKKPSFILILFFVVLLAIPLSLPFSAKAAQQNAVIKQGTLERTATQDAPNLTYALKLVQEGKVGAGLKVLTNLFTSSAFVQKFENLMTEKLLFRVPAIHFSRAIDRAIIKFAYEFTGDSIIPADMRSGIYYDSEFDQLLYTPSFFNLEAKQTIDERTKNYETLIQKNPTQNFYLFYQQTLKNSGYHPLIQLFSEADSGQALEYFEQNLPPGLTFRKFLLTSHQDHLDYYYRTDHHWRVSGIIRAYQEIYDLLSINYPDISPALTITELKTFPDIKFLGHMARQTFYPIQGDDFTVEVITIPSHETIWSGRKIDDTGRLAYFDGKYSTVPYINHYNGFYGEVTDLIEYTFENSSDRNLLIFGSSFQNSLDPLLASHYKKTYCVDLRYYTDFSLSSFLDEHKVDDILIIGDNDVAFQDVEYWKINP